MSRRLPITRCRRACSRPPSRRRARRAPRPASRPARGFAPHQVVVKFEGAARRPGRRPAAGVGVRRAAAALRRNPRVAYAAPNYIATASARRRRSTRTSPTTPARSTARPGPPGGWVAEAVELPALGRRPATPLLPTSPGGIDAVGAWQHLATAKRRGRARASRSPSSTPASPTATQGSRFRRSPDFTAGQFVKGYDFVDHDRAAARRKRPRHPRRRDDRREDQQRHRPDRARLPRQADAGPRPRPQRQRPGRRHRPAASASPSTTAPT